MNSLAGDLSEHVILPGFQVGSVGNESDNPVIGQPVRSPTDEPLVHIVLVRSLRRSFLYIGFPNALVNFRVTPIGGTVAPGFGVGVIRRVANNHADRLFVLLLNAYPVLLGQAPQVEGALTGYRPAGRSLLLPVQVVQRIHEAQIGELQVTAGPFLVGILDVQVGDVVGQDRDFVGVDFVPVLVLQPVGGQVVDQVGYEGARPGSRVKNLHVIVGQGLAEVLLQQVVRPPDDEVHHLVGGIDTPRRSAAAGL